MSKYFTMEEMTHSDTAVRLGKPNKPNKTEQEDLERLMEYLDEVREKFGKPIIVTSGYRSGGKGGVNEAVGGRPDSQHTKGQAADLVAENTIELKRLFGIIRQHGGFDQLILECPPGRRWWIHVSINPRERKPRGQVLEYNGHGYRKMN
ncbi:D-Ala-D-Ala carboxypeptidase family metallohydrolase [uncultured Porphyromonas sp.]|uniref:D-Ala-D-Ala carboxypeptidase family metallohydrolase n=1 Tax=uncultured Porphyromonas sp. TaxID=159274 RepID=UPI002601D30D|nr:D-Ala-D-Ala carboxypeptidase family metallohydrolase [uncultured Porphyromonas sp.]